MTGRLIDLTPNRDGTQTIRVSVDADFTQTFDRLKGCPVNVEIKGKSRKRSLDANAFCWALCSDIGRFLTPPADKGDVYRMAIRAVGVYTQVSVVVWDIPTIERRWTEHGTGWFVDVMDDDGIGKKLLHLYFGSSTYTNDEMHVLIDWLVDQCEQMRIPIPLSKKDRDELIERWKK